MSKGEVRAFEEIPNLAEFVQVRYLDDAGKRGDMTTPGFAYFAPMVQRVVDRHLAGAG